MSALRAPFPWFGGKRRVAPEVWERFGDVPNYVEPFFGSGAVLLGRPAKHAAKTPGQTFTVDNWRLESDAAQLSSREKVAAQKWACEHGYLTALGETLDGEWCALSRRTRHEAGKGRWVELFEVLRVPAPAWSDGLFEVAL